MSGNEVKFLYLSEEDMIRAGVLDMPKCLEAVEKAFKLLSIGDYIMGGPRENQHGIRLYFPSEKRFPNMPVAGPDRRFMSMPSYLGGEFNICAVKWYGSNIENPKRGLPRSIHMITLNDPNTAQPIAVMSGTLLSAVRTGAAPGVAAKHLAMKGASVIGMIGAGVISRASMLGLAAGLDNINEVKVYDINHEKAEEFSTEMTKELGLNIYPVKSLDEAVRDSDVVNFATAGANSPTIREEWLKEGVLLTIPSAAILPEELYYKSKLVVSSWKMVNETAREEDELSDDGKFRKSQDRPAMFALNLVRSGKLKEDDIVELGDVITGMNLGRTSDKEIIISMLSGVPVQDAAWAYEVYKEAKRKGIGQELTLWNEPYWF